MIADPGVGMVKLKPEEFFGEVHEEEVQNINGGSVGGALVGVVLGVCDV